MKFVSALILVCAFACASAQLGVKGGASGSSSGVRYGSYLPQFSPTQDLRRNLYSSNVYYGPSAYTDGGYESTGRLTGQLGYYTPTSASRNFHPSNKVLYSNRQSEQNFGQLSSNLVAPSYSTYPTFARTVFSQPQMTSVQRVSAFDSNGFNSGAFGPVTASKVGRQFVAPSAVSQPAQISTLTSFPSVSQVDYSASSFQPATSGQIFTDNKISTPGLSTLQSIDSTGSSTQTFSLPAGAYSDKQYVTPSVVVRPAQRSTSSFSSFPSTSSGLTLNSAAPALPNRFTVPLVATADLPVSSYQPTTSAVSPIPSGQIFTDNKISSPGYSNVQTVDSTNYGTRTFAPVAVRRQYEAPTLVSKPAPLSSLASFTSYPSASSGYGPIPVGSSVSSYGPATSAIAPASTGQIFTDSRISAPAYSNVQLADSTTYGSRTFGAGKGTRQFVAPSIVSQPALRSTLSFPAGPSVSSASIPVSTYQQTTSAVGPVSSGQIFTDNRISSPGLSTIQSQFPSALISQEKQLADTVQTTEW